MAQNQKTVASKNRMDSRKFLSALNESAQAKTAFFESKIAEMGKSIGKNWQLAALRIKQNNRDQFSGDLFIEDTESHTYYSAEYHREKGGKIVVENILPVEIVEEQKQTLFEQSCLQLITAIESNDQKGMSNAFNKMASQRFSGRAVPMSGVVKTKDGIVRHIPISNGTALGESIKPRLVAAIVEGLRDKVVVENGSVIGGSFNDGEQIKLPVTKWAARKLVGKQMREAAKNAYWSEGFQNRVYEISKLIYEEKIEEAVKSVTPFLREMEEFTLLTRADVQTLIENALAAKACFNQQQCDDTATLFYRTNLKVNRSTIVREWRNIASKVEHPTLMENVHILEHSKNFEASFDKFLELIFEAVSNREVTAEALATTLDVLKNKTPKIKESHDLSGKLNDLIVRLREPDFDDAAIYEAEDLIATIQEELSATENLSDFDSIPGDTSAAPSDPQGLGGAASVSGGGKEPQIVINSPLIQIGGTSGGGSGAAEPPMPEEPMPEEPMGGGMEEEGNDMGELGGEEGGAAGAGGEGGSLDSLLGAANRQGGFGESRNRKGKSINEWEKPWLKDKKKKDSDSDSDSSGSKPWESDSGDSDSDSDNDSDSDSDDSDDYDSDKPWNESHDQYAYRKVNSVDMSDYGAPVINDTVSMTKIVNIMSQLAEQHKLKGRKLEENIENLARASIESIGLRIPKNKLNRAITQVVQTFAEGVLGTMAGGAAGAAMGGPLGAAVGGVAGNAAGDAMSKGGMVGPCETCCCDPCECNGEGCSECGCNPCECEEGSCGPGGMIAPRPRAGMAPMGGQMGGMVGSDFPDMAEDQFKGPSIKKRGYAKSSINPLSKKGKGGVASEGKASRIRWLTEQADGKLGSFGNVNFVFDHGGNSDLPPVILSEDGQVEIPIPENLYDSAFAAANMMNGNPVPFTSWLSESIEQLRPISEDEERYLNEAMATIQANADGSISVSVDGDVDVQDVGGMDDDGETIIDAEDEGMEDGMAPVDTTVAPEDGVEEPTDEMPDFGGPAGGDMDDGMGGGDMGDAMEDPEEVVEKAPTPPGAGGAPEDQDDEEGFMEDDDITEPQSAKYTKHVDDNKRDVPKAKKPKESDDSLEDLGPELHDDDGTGTKSKTAKKNS